jgi:uncharacterized membrane protein
MVTLAPIELMVAVLHQQADSDSALKRLIELNQDGSIELLSAALLLKDDEGKVSLHAVRDLHEAEDALLGALSGGALGLFGGIIGVVVGATAGAAAGYATGHVVDLGVSDEHLQALAQELPSGTSAVLVLIEHESVELAVQELGQRVSSLSRFTLAVEAAAPAGNAG